MTNQILSGGSSRFLIELREKFEHYTLESLGKTKIIGESAALVQITLATVQSAPYAFFSKEFGNNDICHFFSSRFAYLEAALLSVTSLVHNFVLALLYTMANIVTLGLSSTLNHSFYKHWWNCAYAVSAAVIGAAGVVSPILGGALYYTVVIVLFNSLKDAYHTDVGSYEKPILKDIKAIFKNNSALLHDILRSKYGDAEYNNAVKASIEHVEKRLMEATTWEHIATLLVDCYRRWPVMEATQAHEKDPKLGSPAAHIHYQKK